MYRDPNFCYGKLGTDWIKDNKTVRYLQGIAGNQDGSRGDAGVDGSLRGNDKVEDPPRPYKKKEE
jgi:hypothetical protein